MLTGLCRLMQIVTRHLHNATLCMQTLFDVTGGTQYASLAISDCHIETLISTLVDDINTKLVFWFRFCSILSLANYVISETEPGDTR